MLFNHLPLKLDYFLTFSKTFFPIFKGIYLTRSDKQHPNKEKLLLRKLGPEKDT